MLEWLVKQRWKKVAWAMVAALKFNSKIAARGEAAITMQKVVKMFFTRRTFCLLPVYTDMKLHDCIPSVAHALVLLVSGKKHTAYY